MGQPVTDTQRIDKGLILKALGGKERGPESLMPKPATNIVVGKFLLVSAALGWLLSCGDNVQVVPMVPIPRGMRAVSLISDIPVAPGDRVDVLVVAEGQETRAVLQNAEVAAADKESGIVTFLLSLGDAARVTESGQTGKFRLRPWKSD